MNGDDQIQSRRDEITRLETELQEAKTAYRAAVDAPHVWGQLGQELRAVEDANERILHAKHRLEFLEWCNESDEQRMRYETNG